MTNTKYTMQQQQLLPEPESCCNQHAVSPGYTDAKINQKFHSGDQKSSSGSCVNINRLQREDTVSEYVSAHDFVAK